MSTSRSLPRPSTAPRVVVADDSAFMRRLVEAALVEGGFEVVGSAKDGDEALALCASARPDVLTLDLAMPGLDGIAVLKGLRLRGLKVPVVVVSAFSPAHGARAVDALAEGAFDLVAKPEAGRPLREFGDVLRRATTAAHRSRRSRVLRPARRPAEPRRATTARPRAAASPARNRLLVVACSTGGPRALATFVPALPAPLGAGTLLVQHMPPGFTDSLAARLNRASPLQVREAADGDRLDPRALLIAPGGRHMRLSGDGSVRLTDDAPIGALRPRADLTIEDAVRHFGERVVLVVLTGMGRDGLKGAQAVHKAGGRVLIEAEETCTVYGMPRAVADAGLAHHVLPLGELPQAICEELAA